MKCFIAKDNKIKLDLTDFIATQQFGLEMRLMQV